MNCFFCTARLGELFTLHYSSADNRLEAQPSARLIMTTPASSSSASKSSAKGHKEKGLFKRTKDKLTSVLGTSSTKGSTSTTRQQPQKPPSTSAIQNGTNVQNGSVTGPTSTTGSTPVLFREKENPSFKLAIERRLERLNPEEKAHFRKAYSSISTKSALREVGILNNKHKAGSNVRKLDTKVEAALTFAESFMGGVTIAVQAYPDVSCLVVGGLRLVIDVGDLNYPKPSTC